MDDTRIVELYWMRLEDAIVKTEEKYGRYCYSIAYHILSDHQYSEECVSDTYQKAWDTIPPQRPNKLKAFLGRITRNLALNRYDYENAQKRGGAVTVSMEELENCLCVSSGAENVVDMLMLRDVMDQFLASLSRQDRRIFLRRYWYFSDIREIAREYLMTEGQIKMRLHRARAALRKMLEQEGMYR